MCSVRGIQTSLWMGCPIRILRAHRLYAAPPERFAGLRVLLRPSAPRHPPRPLCSLFAFFFLCYLLCYVLMAPTRVLIQVACCPQGWSLWPITPTGVIVVFVSSASLLLSAKLK